MGLESMDKLFRHELKDLYSAEKQILKALPKMSKAATHDQLRNAFENHRKTTEKQVERLERIFEDMGESPTGKKCKGMEGLIAEGQEIIDEDAEPNVRDAALIAAAQRVEHYEIAGYGSARTYARQIGNSRAADLLQETLDEEGETDKELTRLAESMVNPDAEKQGGGGMR